MTTPNIGTTYLSVALLLALLFSSCTPVTQFDVVEATISDMQQAMEEGRLTSRDLVTAHLSRIARYEEEVNAAIAINSHALADADRLDRERIERGIRGPLHGIPVIVKDNYDTAGLPTSAGSLSLVDSIPPDDAFQVRRLREAGELLGERKGEVCAD